MELLIYKDEFKMAAAAAELSAEIINKAIKENGTARILLSTGASQLPFFTEFVKQPIDFSRVEMFHLDEYIGVDETHIASFKRYLKQRFTEVVPLMRAHLIDGMKDPAETIAELTREINRAPIDLALIGIGENAHIAFNDPPADFDDQAAYKVVSLSDTCKAQQVREKWFASDEEVCEQAISMTCSQIMKSKAIISIVPYKVKAQAILDTLVSDANCMIPATLLKSHSCFTLMLDEDSASLYNKHLKEKLA